MKTNRRRAIVWGGLLGGIGISLLSLVWAFSIFGQALSQQQSALMFMATFPLGWLAGSLAGAFNAGEGENSSRELAGETSWVFGGMLLAILLGPVVMLPFSLLLQAIQAK
jgi:hypothetical protein